MDPMGDTIRCCPYLFDEFHNIGDVPEDPRQAAYQATGKVIIE